MAALRWRRLAAAAFALVALCAPAWAAAQCTETITAPVNIATFSSAGGFASGLNDRGGPLTSSAMATFQRDGGGFLVVRPASAAALWSTSLPAAAQPRFSEAVGAVLGFDIGANDPAQFSLTVLTRLATSSAASPPLRRTVAIQPYIPASAGGGAFKSVQVPVQHFNLPINHVLVGVEFSGFAPPFGPSASPVRFDNLHVEYRRCPHRRAVVPLQTCGAQALLIDDLANAANAAARRNALGGQWSDDDTMDTLQVLPASDPRGPGLLLAGGHDAYWYTVLRTPSIPCINVWPYTTLRIEVAASVGMQFDVSLTRTSDDCASPATLAAVRVPSTSVSFNGLAQVRTLDIPLGLLPRSPITAIGISGFYRPPGAPSDGTLQVRLRRITLLRDCNRLAAEMTDAVPPILDSCGPSDTPQIALSFDGPSMWVDGILDYLNSQNIKATFFIEPGAIIDRPEPPNDNGPLFDQDGYPLIQSANSDMCRLVRRIVAEGHDFGDHSYTHPRYARRSGGHAEGATLAAAAAFSLVLAGRACVGNAATPGSRA